MSVCQIHLALMAEAEKTMALLTELMNRRREAVDHGHENTLLILDQELERQFHNLHRVFDAVQKHRKEHAC